MFGLTPKAVESVGEVRDGAKLMVQRVDNILKEINRKYRSVQSDIIMSNQ
jgi:hypothetical protein